MAHGHSNSLGGVGSGMRAASQVSLASIPGVWIPGSVTYSYYRRGLAVNVGSGPLLETALCMAQLADGFKKKFIFLFFCIFF